MSRITLSDLYSDKVGHKDNNSCASDRDWKDRKNPEDDLKNSVSDMVINDDEVNDLVNDLNDKHATTSMMHLVILKIL